MLPDFLYTGVTSASFALLGKNPLSMALFIMSARVSEILGPAIRKSFGGIQIMTNGFLGFRYLTIFQISFLKENLVSGDCDAGMIVIISGIHDPFMCVATLIKESFIIILCTIEWAYSATNRNSHAPLS